MLHINLILLGKLKETFWQQAEAEYLKRLQPWAKVTIYELKEESFGEKDTAEHIKQKEAEKIMAALSKIKDTYIIALDETGKQFSSPALAKQIGQITDTQNNQLTFIIGGPLGLDESIIKRADLKLSLSTLTFTHQMARVFLWEQIYRALCINSGKKYHY